MKFSTSLVILTSAVTGAMAEGCYSGGQAWATQACLADFKGAIADHCNSGALAGYFNNNGYKSKCANCLSSGIRVDLGVGWKGPGGYSLNSGDCIRELSDLLDRCYRGGEHTNSNWYF
jgi:hypothetical protein